MSAGGCPLQDVPWRMPPGGCPLEDEPWRTPPGCPVEDVPWRMPTGGCPLEDVLWRMSSEDVPWRMSPGGCPLRMPPGGCPLEDAPWMSFIQCVCGNHKQSTQLKPCSRTHGGLSCLPRRTIVSRLVEAGGGEVLRRYCATQKIQQPWRPHGYIGNPEANQRQTQRQTSGKPPCVAV